MTIPIYKNYKYFFAVLCISLIITKLLNYELIHNNLRVILFPLLILYYLKKKRRVNKSLFFFLVSFCLAELFIYFIYTANPEDGIVYITCNAFFVLGYIFLIALLLSNLDLKQLLSHFYIHILIISAMGAYLFKELNSTITPFISKDILDTFEYLLNIIYNLVILIALGLALLNYFSYHSKIALKLLIACSTLIFSEFFQIFYYNNENSGFFSALTDNAYIALLAISYFYFLWYINSLKA